MGYVNSLEGKYWKSYKFNILQTVLYWCSVHIPLFFFLNRQDSIPPQYLRHISYFRAPSSTSSANAMLMVQNRLWKLACLPTKWPNGELDSPSRSNGGCCGARHLALLGHPWTLHDCRESVQLRLKTLENSAKQPTAER